MAVRRLRAAARILRHLIDDQWRDVGHADLDVRAISEHLATLAEIVAREGLKSAGESHLDFSVVPHGAWLGRRKRRRRSYQSARAAGYKGGRSRSLEKVAASRSNLVRARKCRKVNRAGLVAQLAEWAEQISLDQSSVPRAAKSALLEARLLPRRTQAELRKILKGKRIRLRRIWKAIVDERKNNTDEIAHHAQVTADSA